MRAVIYDPGTGAILQTIEGGDGSIAATAVALSAEALDVSEVPDEEYYGGIDTTHEVNVGGENPILQEVAP